MLRGIALAVYVEQEAAMSTKHPYPRGKGVPASEADERDRVAGSFPHANAARPLNFGLPYAISGEPKPPELWFRR